MVEVDMSCAVWILTLLLYLILIIIFAQTSGFVKRSCQKQLSNDRQRPLAAANNHIQSTKKRAAFIIHVGFLEVCAGLVVVIAKFDIVRRPNLREMGNCTGYHQCAGQLHAISCAIVGCLFLSIVCCLAQRYVLGRLSKADIESMTRIYVVPATCFVTALCVWSWLRLYGDRERKQSSDDKMAVVCGTHVVTETVPLNFFGLILLPIFWNLFVDYLEYRKERKGRIWAYMYVGSQATADDVLKCDSTFLKQTNQVPQVDLSQNYLVHTSLMTTCPSSENDKEISDVNPALLLTDATLQPERNTTISGRRQFTAKTGEIRAGFGTLRDFLDIYARNYTALLVYLAALSGVYAFLANCRAFSGTEDFTAAMFMTILVVIGMLRVMQVAVAEAENKDGFKCEKMRQFNV